MLCEVMRKNFFLDSARAFLGREDSEKVTRRRLLARWKKDEAAVCWTKFTCTGPF